MVGSPCWIDLITSDLAGAVDFYSSLFAWSVAEDFHPEQTNYVTFHLDGYPIAGTSRRPEGTAVEDAWMMYLQVESSERVVAEVVAAGGSIALAPQQVGQQGKMAVITDPAGATLGLWEPENQSGFELIDEPGTPIWFECWTDDYPATVSFYRDLFGWEFGLLNDAHDLRYSTARVAGVAIAGVLDAGRDPSHDGPRWWPLFGSEAPDLAADTVVALGGGVLEAPSDSPLGRVATLADPTGAAFRVAELVPADD